jgi:hypothetical protein
MVVFLLELDAMHSSLSCGIPSGADDEQASQFGGFNGESRPSYLREMTGYSRRAA